MSDLYEGILPNNSVQAQISRNILVDNASQFKIPLIIVSCAFGVMVIVCVVLLKKLQYQSKARLQLNP